MEKLSRKQLETQLIQEITTFLSKTNVKAAQKMEKLIKTASKDLIKKLSKKIDQAEDELTKLAKEKAESLKKSKASPAKKVVAKKSARKVSKKSAAVKTASKSKKVKRSNIKLPTTRNRKK